MSVLEGIGGLVLLIVVLLIAAHKPVSKILRHLRPAWLWLSGHSMDGVARTNATWTMRSRGERPVLHPSGHAVAWHHLPRLHRAGIRTSCTLAVAATSYGLIANWNATVHALLACAIILAAFAAWQIIHTVENWQHERHNIRPLERSLMHRLRTRPDSIEVHRDAGDAITGVVIEWPPQTEIGTAEKEHVLEAVSARLPIESPEPQWSLKGRSRLVTFTPSEPPPVSVSWDDVAAAVFAAAFNELVFGPGRRGAIVTAKYGDSPHLAVPGGSGGGKSNLIAFLLLQELMRGTLVFILDPKGDSHLWAVGLPNIIYCVKPEQIHMALEWLGAERVRRGDTSYWSAVQNSGIDRAKPGGRIVAVLEEMNIGMPGLKAHWAAVRDRKSDPKESPAIGGMREGACAGRSQDMHFWLAAQMLNVESTGVRDSTIRSQAGIKAMLRWEQRGWDMAVGKEVPMPPSVKTPGRSQIVTADGPRECQTPYLHLDDKDHPEIHEKAVRWARELAVSRDVAKIPGGPGGVPLDLWPPVVRQKKRALNTGGEATTGATVAPPPVPPALTISEAVGRGVFGNLALGAARRRVQRARLQEIGTRDGAKEYLLSELHQIARSGK